MRITRRCAFRSRRIVKFTERDDRDDHPQRKHAPKVGDPVALQTDKKWPNGKKNSYARENAKADKIRGALTARTVSNCRRRPRQPEQQRMMPRKPRDPRI